MFPLFIYTSYIKFVVFLLKRFSLKMAFLLCYMLNKGIFITILYTIFIHLISDATIILLFNSFLKNILKKE